MKRTPRPGEMYELVPGYDSARKICLRMKAANLLDYHKTTDKTNPGFWCLKGRPAPSKWNWQHEVDAGNLMIAFRNTDLLISWDAKWDADEYREFAKKHGVNYDRRMQLEGVSQLVFIEVDRGNEDLGVLREKVQKYIRLAQSFPGDPFVVIFTLQARLSSNLAERANSVLERVLKPFGRGKQFVIAPHEMLLRDPMGKVLVSYSDPSSSFSVLDL